MYFGDDGTRKHVPGDGLDLVLGRTCHNCDPCPILGPESVPGPTSAGWSFLLTPSFVSSSPARWKKFVSFAPGMSTVIRDALLTQMERILEVNSLREVTKAVVEAARESLVIGQAQRLEPTLRRALRHDQATTFLLTDDARAVNGDRLNPSAFSFSEEQI